MHPVAIRADSAVVPGIGPFRLIDRDIDAMPGKVIQVIDIRVQTVFRHQVLFAWHPAHRSGDFDPEVSRAWVLDVMDAVTIGADRDIGVIFLDQGAAVDAGLILLVDICSWHCPQVVEISERGCAGGFTL